LIFFVAQDFRGKQGQKRKFEKLPRLSVNSESYRRVDKISSLAAAFDPKARMNFACGENERRKRDGELEAYWLFLENHPPPTYTPAAESAGEIIMFFKEQNYLARGGGCFRRIVR